MVNLKKFLKVIVFLLLIVISICLIFINNGYKMYREAIDNVSLEEKVEAIENKENYTKFSELPQMYINAVISVEDKRFFKHNGIDVFAKSFLSHTGETWEKLAQKIEDTVKDLHFEKEDIFDAILNPKKEETEEAK